MGELGGNYDARTHLCYPTEETRSTMMITLSQRRVLCGLSFVTCFALVGCGGGGNQTTPVGPSPFAATMYVYAGTLGKIVDTNGLGPSRLVVDASKNVFAAFPSANQIQTFSNSGSPRTPFGTFGSGNGQFGNSGPLGVALDGVGTIYATDYSNHRIEKFKEDGTYLGQFDTKDLLPTAVAVDAQGTIYVNGSAGLVYKFSSNGTFQNQMDVQGSGVGQVGIATGLAVDSVGDLYITDARNNKVVVLKSDGTFFHEFGTQGTGNGQLYEPEGIAVDGSDNIYVADAANNRIEKFKSDGTYLSQFSTSVGSNGRVFPQGVTVDGSGVVYVSDDEHPAEYFTPAL